MCVVIENPQLEIIRTSDEPILARDEFDTTYWDFCNLECFDYGACVVVVDVDGAIVESCEKPGFCWVEINALDAI